MLTQKRLLELFHVDFENGELHRRKPIKYRQGREPLRLQECSRYYIQAVDGKPYKRGRLIFLAAYGRFPTPTLDHIDGNSRNDALSNLREATRAQNVQNQSRIWKKTKYPRGVAKSGKGYMASITHYGNRYYLGVFPTAEKASEAYETMSQKLKGEFYRK